MIRLHKLCLALVTLAAFGLHAQTASATEVGKSRNFGLGIALGEPMAMVGKVFIDEDNAVDFGVGFFRLWNRCRTRDGVTICGGFGSFTFNADYLWQFKIVEGRSAKLDWHIGAGGRIWLADNDDNQDLAIAGRMPVGVDLTFNKPDFIEVYLEVAPAMYVFPDFGVAPEGNIGVRFYF
jgi:hypothetical protein